MKVVEVVKTGQEKSVARCVCQEPRGSGDASVLHITSQIGAKINQEDRPPISSLNPKVPL
ncbi:hypothetical protein E2C01_034455 [Portunus trituberculatus]|uniref:Uncharacterized protein n=1 Tax=Portunus trituberculatus TaxID=210409 RepID=A0A5B7F1N0_PORTR|nr:hypothetical protein [Portunus trituberculatus]